MQPQKRPSSQAMTWGLAALFAVLGVQLSGVPGLLGGGVLGALLGQVLFLRERMQFLEEQLRSFHRLPPAADDVQPQIPVEPETPVFTQEQRPASEANIPPTPPSVVPDVPRYWQEAVAKGRDGLVNWLKRGNPLARIGIVILFFGAAFLAKYAADNSLIPIELRLAGLAAGAFALLGIGWRLRHRRAVYAQLLQGGGIAGLYLTVFAATRLYPLLPVGLAFGLLVLIALAAAILAVGQNALALAVIGTAGGFLAPVLVSTGSGNHIALFSYYAVLNLGVLAVAWFRSWRLLGVLGLLFTFGITGLWRLGSYEPADRISADAFLILFFLMYVGVSVLNAWRQAPDLKGYVSGSLVFGLPVVAFALHASLVESIEYALAISAFVLGAFYLLLAAALFRTGRSSLHLLVEAFAALGVIFASLAIPLAFDGRTTAAVWAVEGAGLLWLGVRQQRKLPRLFGGLLQLAGGVGYIGSSAFATSTLPVFNSAYLGALMLALSGVFSGYWMFRNEALRAQYERFASLLFTLWGLLWWLGGGIVQIERFMDDAETGGLLGYVALTVALLSLLGARRHWRLVLQLALGLTPVFALLVLLRASGVVHPFADWGAPGWMALIAAHLLALYLAQPREVAGQRWFHAAAYWIVVWVLAWESSWQIGEQTTGVWAQLPWGVLPALALAWLGREQLLPRWPLQVNEAAYRVYAAVPLVIACVMWIVRINLSSTGDATWLPYLPLLNPLDVSVVLCLVAITLWWSSLQDAQRARLWPFASWGLMAALAALVFLWLNAALIRSLHHNFGAPMGPGLMSATLVQASLSIFWGLLGFAAMVLAARRHWRYVWLAGAGLMIVVVIKLFLVDLSNVGTIARITSFLTVGGLLLVTGYLAPLPPRSGRQEIEE